MGCDGVIRSALARLDNQPNAMAYSSRLHACAWGSGDLAAARRVVRGGSWNNDYHNARAAYRNRNNPDNRNNNVGFRVVRAAHVPLPFSGLSATGAGGRVDVVDPGMGIKPQAALHGCSACGVPISARVIPVGGQGEGEEWRRSVWVVCVASAWRCEHSGTHRARGRALDSLPARPPRMSESSDSTESLAARCRGDGRMTLVSARGNECLRAPLSPAGLPDPAAEEPADLRNHLVDVAVLSIRDELPLTRQPDVQPHLVELRVGCLKTRQPRLARPCVCVVERLLEVERRIQQALGDEESVFTRELQGDRQQPTRQVEGPGQNDHLVLG